LTISHYQIIVYAAPAEVSQNFGGILADQTNKHNI